MKHVVETQDLSPAQRHPAGMFKHVSAAHLQMHQATDSASPAHESSEDVVLDDPAPKVIANVFVEVAALGERGPKGGNCLPWDFLELILFATGHEPH